MCENINVAENLKNERATNSTEDNQDKQQIEKKKAY